MRARKRTRILVGILCAMAWCCSHCHIKRTQHETIIILDDSLKSHPNDTLMKHFPKDTIRKTISITL